MVDARKAARRVCLGSYTSAAPAEGGAPKTVSAVFELNDPGAAAGDPKVRWQQMHDPGGVSAPCAPAAAELDL